jgi:hypothetical protein
MLPACGDDGPASPGDVEVSGVNDYLNKTIKHWDDYPGSGPVSDTGRGDKTVETMTETLQEIEEDGSVTTRTDVPIVCETETWDVKNNPDKVVMFNPNADILYPGALLVGKSHIESPVGGFRPLTLAATERGPIKVSVANVRDLPGDSFREVNNPSKATVENAINQIFGGGLSGYSADSLVSGSKVFFNMREYYSEKQFAIQSKIKASGLSWDANAEGSYSQKRVKSTVAVQFIETMYTVTVDPPPSGNPGAWFSDKFTDERLQSLIDQGFMGPDNPPVYVASVTYGRMMMFAMSSYENADTIKAALKASWDGLVTSGSVSISTKYSTLLRESDVKILSVGGDASATQDMIRTGSWQQYFTKNAPLTTAVPVSFVLRSLRDGVVASVHEFTDYKVPVCFEGQLGGLAIDFGAENSIAVNVGGVPNVVFGSFYNNGLDNTLAWYYGEPGNQQFQTGAFWGTGVIPVVSYQSNMSNSSLSRWNELYAGDMNGDGYDDLMWNPRSNTGQNFVYFVENNKDGSFAAPVESAVPDPSNNPWSWQPWALNTDVLVGDHNGDGREDLIWASRPPSGGFGLGDLGLYMGTLGGPLDNTVQMHRVHYTAWDHWWRFPSVVANFDGDARTDLYFTHETPGAGNPDVVVIKSTGFMADPRQWGGFQQLNYGANDDSWETSNQNEKHFFAGDLDGDQLDDIIGMIIKADGKTVSILKIMNDNGGFNNNDQIQDFTMEDVHDRIELGVGDFDADGRADIVLSGLDDDGRHNIYLGKNSPGGGIHPEFKFNSVGIRHPDSRAWTSFTLHVKDVDNTSPGDELIWVKNTTGTSDIYVAKLKELRATLVRR